MAEWRFLRGWSDEELEIRLRGLRSLSGNFHVDDTSMNEATGWRRQDFKAIVAHEKPGPPEDQGPFERLRIVLRNYEFSDPRIVTAHFDREDPLVGRRMLLEIRILGLRYLTGTVITAVCDEERSGESLFGFRYETLEGHLEAGWEWFLIRKDHATGEIRFTIEAQWRYGEFPNAWTRIGFKLLARRMQRRWHRKAQKRMSLLSQKPIDELRRESGKIAHEGP